MRDRSPLPIATIRAARIWLRGAKQSRVAAGIGGGWWSIRGIGRVQGYFDLARALLNAGVIDRTGAFTGKQLPEDG